MKNSPTQTTLHHRTRPSFKVLGLISLTVFFIILSYYYLDRPLVWLLYTHHTRHWIWLRLLSDHIPTTIGASICLYYIACISGFILNRTDWIHPNILPICHAGAIALFMKTLIKKVFGRYWPGTFICHNPSLIQDHVYGFNWFQSGSAYESFPSGHTAFTVACLVSLCWMYPKFRIIWILIALAVALSQIILYYHFLSDVIAGALLGSLIAYCIVHMMQDPRFRTSIPFKRT